MERGLIAFPYFRTKLKIKVEELVAFGVELMDDVVVPHPVGAHEGFVGDKAPDAMLHQELSLCQTRQRLAFWIPRISCDSVPSSVSPEKISGLVETSDLLRFFFSPPYFFPFFFPAATLFGLVSYGKNNRTNSCVFVRIPLCSWQKSGRMKKRPV